MNPLSIGNATEIYSNASQCEIVRQWLDHPQLAEVSRLIRTLVRSLGDEGEDDYWRHTLGPLRKLAFAFCSVPIPFAQAAAATGIDWDKVRRQVRLCQHTFPDSHASLVDIAHKLEQLSAETSSPFIGPLEELLRQKDNLSVMMRNPRMAGDLER